MYLYATLVIDPFGNFSKRSLQKFNVEMILVPLSEIEILRKAVCFKVALFQAGAAFEYPV